MVRSDGEALMRRIALTLAVLSFGTAIFVEGYATRLDDTTRATWGITLILLGCLWLVVMIR